MSIQLGSVVSIPIHNLIRDGKSIAYIGLKAFYRAGMSTAYYKFVDTPPDNLTGIVTSLDIENKLMGVEISPAFRTIKMDEFSLRPYIRKDGTTSDYSRPQPFNKLYAVCEGCKVYIPLKKKLLNVAYLPKR